MKIINMDCFNMQVVLHEADTDTGYIGTMTSNLHDGGADVKGEDEKLWDHCIDAIESLILGHACAGIDITTNAYIEGVETSVLALENNIC